MSSLSPEEVRRRLRAVTNGPWARSLERTHENLAAPDLIRFAIEADQPIRLNTLRLSLANRKKNDDLAEILRSHHDDPEGVTKDDEKQVRDALDDALTIPQLYELAVQTGYLPADSVRQPARSLLTKLLWSGAARRFVDDYDYVALPMLAARVDVAGLSAAEPPAPDERAALRFAGFLAHLRAFYEDDAIGEWTRFLDDYVVVTNEQEHIWRYLRGKRSQPPPRLGALMTGCTRFVTSLASAFHTLDDDELGRFGLIHAYWLQKFFGFERVDGRYVKDVELWGDSDSWAATVSTSEHLTDGINVAWGKVLREQFTEDIQVLERTFEAVRQLCEATRESKTSVPRRSSSQGRQVRRGR